MVKKCWKKMGDKKYKIEFAKKYGEDFVDVIKIKDGWMTLSENEKFKKFKTKSSALRYANYYMRKNNKC